MPRKPGSKKKTTAGQQANRTNGGGSASTVPGIRASELRRVEKGVAQIMSIGTHLQSFVSQLGGATAPAAGQVVKATTKRSSAKALTAGGATTQ